MVQSMTDPFTMPQGLPTPEQKWWTATVAEIRRYKRLAKALEAEGNTAQAKAEEARGSYRRLKVEYRGRWAGKRPEWATDAIFVTLPVAKDCIDDDQFYSRQAVEKYTAAQSFWARAAQLTTEMIDFSQRRKERLLAQVPQQREGQ